MSSTRDLIKEALTGETPVGDPQDPATLDLQKRALFDRIMERLAEEFSTLPFPASLDDAEGRVQGFNLVPDLLLSACVLEMWEGNNPKDPGGGAEILDECIRLMEWIQEDVGLVIQLLRQIRAVDLKVDPGFFNSGESIPGGDV